MRSCGALDRTHIAQIVLAQAKTPCNLGGIFWMTT
jgi:hypothetical protein